MVDKVYVWKATKAGVLGSVERESGISLHRFRQRPDRRVSEKFPPLDHGTVNGVRTPVKFQQR